MIVVVAVLISCLLAVLLSFGFLRNRMSAKALDVVVARYEEDLDWVVDDLMPMLDAEARVVVYNKGRRETLSAKISDAKIQVVDLPNVGREGHTYLHHILETHGRARKPVLFLPGSCRAFPEKWAKAKKIIGKFDGASSTFVCDGIMPADIYNFSIDRWAARESKNNATNSVDRLVPSPVRPFGKWFDEVVRISDKDPPRCLSLGGMFIAAPKDLDRKTRAYYERIKAFLDGDDNVEAGHYVERAWPAIVLT
jgi:hypothetical protein